MWRTMNHRDNVRAFWLAVGELIALVGRGIVALGEWIKAGADPDKRP